MKKPAALSLTFFMTGALMISSLTAQGTWKQQLAQATDAYFDQVYFHYAPSAGTMTGFHQYDGRLEDFSRPAIDAEIAALKSFEQRIESIQPDNSADDFVPRTDREIVLSNIRSQLLTLETIRPWEKNADSYSSTCANAACKMRNLSPLADDVCVRTLNCQNLAGDMVESIDNTAAILPRTRSFRTETGSCFSDKRTSGLASSHFTTDADESRGLAKAIETLGVPPPINPKTKIKISGKPKLKATALGFRRIALKLPLAIASMALS